MERYIHEIDGTHYSTGELLAEIFNGFNEEINLLAKNSNFTYIEDIDMQNNTYNLYCLMDDDTRLASKIFLTFHPQKTLFRNYKYMVTINMSHDQNQFPYKIYKKLPSILKKKVKSIKEMDYFRGKVKSIKA